jgi:hypothetical protein
MTTKTITPEQLAADLKGLRLDQEARRALAYASQAEPGSKTRHNRLLAAGRDTFARHLCAVHGIKPGSALTKAIRAGHNGEPDWTAINQSAADVLLALHQKL